MAVLVIGALACVLFFFQAEDGIRDHCVTGVQTCALPILSWAPVNVVWGRDNRTTGFRLVGRGPALHVEDRFPGGDMNAYLTYAAMIGAGLYGIEHKLTLSPNS